MQLKSLEYSEFRNTPQEWVLHPITLGKSNLLVGQNSSGKTRCLNIIQSVAKHLLGKMPVLPLSGKHDCEFIDANKHYRYILECQDSAVLYEQLTIDGKILLERSEGGAGQIYAEEMGKQIRFQSPPSGSAAVTRRDSIQHSFLEPLHKWAASLRHYNFGSTLGKDRIGIHVPGAPKVDETDQDAVIGIFRDGKKEFGNAFIEAIISDMQKIGYELELVDTGPPITFQIEANGPELLGIRVKEKDLPGLTDQFSMSQGMFRVLALIIHVNYFQMKKAASCLLVDDIGEGLDFDRSCRLIDRLRTKTQETDLQLILSTNDRFVMNKVPLEEWGIIQRKGNNVYIINSENSPAIFDEFRFTGLSNFSFLELDFLGKNGKS